MVIKRPVIKRPVIKGPRTIISLFISLTSKSFRNRAHVYFCRL